VCVQKDNGQFLKHSLRILNKLSRSRALSVLIMRKMSKAEQVLAQKTIDARRVRNESKVSVSVSISTTS
jgi:hypothetical protein